MTPMTQHAARPAPRRALPALAALLVLAVASVSADAAPGETSRASTGVGAARTAPAQPLLIAQREKPRVSLDQAVAKVRARYEGRVIRAETRYPDGKPVHHVKLLSPDGKVRTIRVDGITGRIR